MRFGGIEALACEQEGPQQSLEVVFLASRNTHTSGQYPPLAAGCFMAAQN